MADICIQTTEIHDRHNCTYMYDKQARLTQPRALTYVNKCMCDCVHVSMQSHAHVHHPKGDSTIGSKSVSIFRKFAEVRAQKDAHNASTRRIPTKLFG